MVGYQPLPTPETFGILFGPPRHHRECQKGGWAGVKGPPKAAGAQRSLPLTPAQPPPPSTNGGRPRRPPWPPHCHSATEHRKCQHASQGPPPTAARVSAAGTESELDSVTPF